MRQFLVFLLVLTTSLFAEDWPQFLGPRRDGSYQGKALSIWPAEGPRKIWGKKIGSGWSGVVVDEGRVIIFHRKQGMEIIDCNEAPSGKPLWTYKYACDFRDQFGKDDGPRGTPAIANGRVYTMGASGIVVALDLKTGKTIWRVDTRRQFGANLGFFGMACSPLIHNKRLLLNIGGKDNAGIIALNAHNGKLHWNTSRDNTSYSSPIIAQLDGKEQALFFTRTGLESVEAATGKTLYKFPWRPTISASVNAATPLVSGNLVFISTSYNKGGALIAVKDNRTETVWARNDVMSNQYATCVLCEGHLYGFHGRADIGGCELRCVELKTGKMKWSFPGLRAGTVMLAGKELLILTERGELLRAPASPAAFRPTARVQLMGATVRAYPALANGKLYVRNSRELICFKVGE